VVQIARSGGVVTGAGAAIIEHMVDEQAISWQLGRGTCGALTFSGAHGKPQDCGRVVTHAGLVLTRRGDPPRWECWRAFSCS
jgi:hypothetical protein